MPSLDPPVPEALPSLNDFDANFGAGAGDPQSSLQEKRRIALVARKGTALTFIFSKIFLQLSD